MSATKRWIEANWPEYLKPEPEGEHPSVRAAAAAFARLDVAMRIEPEPRMEDVLRTPADRAEFESWMDETQSTVEMPQGEAQQTDQGEA